MRGDNGAERGRGIGPFSGRQLTAIIVAFMAAVVAYPFAAGAASAVFSNNSATVPAVQGTNTNAKGVGVRGTGKQFGVFSDGALGVASGRHLICSGCVDPRALSKAAKAPQPLGKDESESGVFSAAPGDSIDGLMVSTISFAHPLPIEANVVYAANWPVAHCSGPGHAERLYLCLYPQQQDNASEAFVNFGSGAGTGSPAWGFTIAFNVLGADAYVQGIWTVTSGG